MKLTHYYNKIILSLLCWIIIVILLSELIPKNMGKTKHNILLPENYCGKMTVFESLGKNRAFCWYQIFGWDLMNRCVNCSHKAHE